MILDCVIICRFTVDGVTGTLMLLAANYSDSGTYTCTVQILESPATVPTVMIQTFMLTVEGIVIVEIIL